jgi:predicted nucleic acid-binding protein
LTIGELKKGIEALPEGTKKRRLLSWLEEKVVYEFTQHILAIDLDVALVWGQLQGELQRKGIRLPVIDGLLAATALSHRLTLVTRNTKDFAPANVPVINPWS